jgi:hypothetical protein
MTLPAPARQGFLQAVARMSVDAILLGNIFDAQSRWHVEKLP